MTEKRRHPRVPLGLTLAIELKGQPVAKCRGAISDLSQGGMLLTTDAELEPGMCLHLKLDKKLHIRGEVRHSKGVDKNGFRRYGVRFHRIQEN